MRAQGERACARARAQSVHDMWAAPSLARASAARSPRVDLKTPGHLHTPECDAPDEEGHTTRTGTACGEGKIHLTPLSPGRRGGATARSAP